MSPTLTLLLAALFSLPLLTSGLVSNGPKATGIGKGDDINTEGHGRPAVPVQTPAPDIAHAELFKRSHYETVLIAPDNICGYFGGNQSSYYSCVGTTLRCNYYLSYYSTDSTTVGVVACCPSTGLCDAAAKITQCIDSKAHAAGSTCSDTLGCVSCISTPFLFCEGATFPALGLKDYLCGESSVAVFDTASPSYINQFPDRVYLTSSYLALDPVVSTSSTSTQTSTLSTSSQGPVTTSPTGNTPGGGPSTPIGPIVGGVIGGVAVIALIVALIWYFRRRHKRQVNNNQPSPQVPQPMYPSPVLTDPKAPYSQQSSPVQPQYFQQQQQQSRFQEQLPYYQQQQGYGEQQAYNYNQQGEQFPQHQYYNSYQVGEGNKSTVGGAPPIPHDQMTADTITAHGMPHAPTSPYSSTGLSTSPNPQHNDFRQQAFEIQGD